MLLPRIIMAPHPSVSEPDAAESLERRSSYLVVLSKTCTLICLMPNLSAIHKPKCFSALHGDLHGDQGALCAAGFATTSSILGTIKKMLTLIEGISPSFTSCLSGAAFPSVFNLHRVAIFKLCSKFAWPVTFD